MCTCHDPLVFGHRCKKEQCGGSYPATGVISNLEDLLATEARVAALNQEVAELNAAISGGLSLAGYVLTESARI